MSKRHRLPSPALLISMVALALVLGGTAVAASTASDPDKRSDTTLIRTLAPLLSVKHATSATLLQGKDAKSLETSAYLYVFPTNFGTGATTLSLPGLPPGRYDASYDIYWQPDTAGKSVGCWFLVNGDAWDYSISAPYDGSDYVSTSGAGYLDTRTHSAQLQCAVTGGSFALGLGGGGSLILEPIDRMTGALATVAATRRGAPSWPGHAATGGR